MSIVCDGVASMTSYGIKAHETEGFYIWLAYHLSFSIQVMQIVLRFALTLC